MWRVSDGPAHTIFVRVADPQEPPGPAARAMRVAARRASERGPLQGTPHSASERGGGVAGLAERLAAGTVRQGGRAELGDSDSGAAPRPTSANVRP